MRPIDADKPRKTFVDWLNWYKGSEAVKSVVREAVDVLDETPTIEAEPVVRCKVCKYSKKFYITGNRYCEFHGAHVYPVSDDDYCSFGEKMDLEG